MIEPLAPRPHQQQALTDLTRGFQRNDRVTIVMAPGSGKTLVGRWAAEQQEAELTLVVVPSLTLVAQTLRAWQQPPGWPTDALVICSDPTTAAGLAERDSADGGEVNSRFWSRHHAQVTTDVASVRRALVRQPPGRPLVLFSTYHSVWVAAQAARTEGRRFDLVVADEAHHLAGAPREDFRVVLDSAALPASRRIFMTATPVSSPAGSSLLSMSDEALFGPVVHRLNFADAVAAQLLCDYEVLVFEAAGQTTPDPVAALVAGTAGLHSVLTFHGRVAKARAFASAVDGVMLPDGRRVVAAAVAGTDPDGQRQQALRLLADPRPDQLVVVSSARCLAEGVDIPAVDGVMFVDPKQSTVDVVQAVGRSIRKSPGKARGLVLLPVCIPADVDDDTVLSTSAFANVWRVLRGLRTLDTRLCDELAVIARSPARA